MTDIGNGHQQAPAFVGRLAAPLGCGLAVHGIVKIACVFTVNGYQWNIGQINAIDLVLGAHFVWQRSRQRNTGLRELVRNAVLAHRNFNLHARVVHLAQHFLDATYRLSKQGRWLHQLHHNNLTDPGQAGGGFGNQHILPIAFVFGGNQPDTALLQQATDDGLRRSLHNFNHPPFGAPFAVAAHNAHLDPILVQHRPHLIGGQIDIRRTVVARYKTVPVAMTLHNSFNFVQQAAGLAHIFDTIILLSEMPRWRNW
jgi:hypothetical protein